MRRFAVLLVVLTACGPAAGNQLPTPTVQPDPTDATVGAAGTVDTTTTESVDTATTLSDRPLAPDFTLELGDGGGYNLSEAVKPVYLIFWAEW